MSERRRGKEEKQNVVHAGRGHGVGVGALLALASLLAVGGTTRERWPEETLRYEHQGAGLASLTNSRLLLRSGGRVAFPSYADGPLRIETPTGEALAFSLAGAAAHPRIVTNAGAAYRDVLGPGAHLWQQPVDAGIEDFLRFPRRPADEEVSYVLRPEGFAGLRLVANVLELLDPAGVPRLRMAPPYILDAAGTARQPQVSLHDCAYDADPRGPWGRPVVAPGAAACVVRIAWADQAVSYPAVLDPAWTTTGSMTVARKTHTATELPDGKVLVAGGESPTGAIFTSAELYDPASKTWSPTGNMNRPRQYFTATLVRVGGQPRVLAVAGGATATMEIASSETYDPAIGVWTLTAPDLEMKQIRRFHTASLLGDGRVLVAGGLVGQPGFAGGLTSIEIYDPMTGAWTKGSDLLAGRAGHTASVLTNGNVLITGGYKFGVDTFASTEVYDVANGTWANGATMAAGRAGHTATLLQNGQVLVVGGLSSGLNFLSTAELVKADGQQLIGTGSLANTRFTHTATLLPDGRVLAAGGQGSATEVVTKTEIYDPAKGVWLLAGNALQSRAFHTASRLFGGNTVLIAGGVSNTVVYDSAELFAILPRGGTCVDDGECVTGFCGSGVCCETACKGACESCLAKEKGGGVDGTCGAVAAPCPPPVAPSCDGDHTLTNPAGSKNDCTPYKCAGSSCKITCDSVDDCVVPNLCDGRTRSCLLARDGATVDHGCTCHVGAPARSFAGSRAVAALLLGALVRRGRRKPVSLRFRSFLLGIKQRLGKKRPGSLHLAA